MLLNLTKNLTFSGNKIFFKMLLNLTKFLTFSENKNLNNVVELHKMFNIFKNKKLIMEIN